MSVNNTVLRKNADQPKFLVHHTTLLWKSSYIMLQCKHEKITKYSYSTYKITQGHLLHSHANAGVGMVRQFPQAQNENFMRR